MASGGRGIVVLVGVDRTATHMLEEAAGVNQFGLATSAASYLFSHFQMPPISEASDDVAAACFHNLL
jgi:hypothetical protein